MSEQAQGSLSDLGDFRYWKPEAQQQALAMLQEHERSGWRPFFCKDPHCDGEPHGNWNFPHAREDQRPPPWAADWFVLLFRGGRGSGKTRAGSEFTQRATKITHRIALVAPTVPALRDTLVEGESGLLATAPPGNRPVWEPSKRRLTWPNGCIGQGYTAEEPDRLRGPEHGFAWLDEPAHYDFIDEVWDNLLMGLRIKTDLRGRPLRTRIVCTTTPLPTKWIKDLIKDPGTVNRVVSSYANIKNLSETFRKTVLSKYEGTRRGKQELFGEILEDVEGALWEWAMFRYAEDVPDLTTIVVAIDPAGSTNKRADETGIVVLGIAGDTIYVLEDGTGKFSPAGWGKKAHDLAEKWHADRFVAEKNYGGEMVEHVLQTEAEKRLAVTPRIELVNSRRGKELRAEPIVALYEQGRILHAGERGDLNDLEEEQTSWVPGKGASPNRVDALVHGATDLAKKIGPSEIANPNTVLANYMPHPSGLWTPGTYRGAPNAR